MGKRLKIRICVGTNCYLVGGAGLLELEDALPSKVKDAVEIEGAACLGLCKDVSNGKPPFVIVGDKLIVEADMYKVIDEVMHQLGDNENDR